MGQLWLHTGEEGQASTQGQADRDCLHKYGGPG